MYSQRKERTASGGLLRLAGRAVLLCACLTASCNNDTIFGVSRELEDPSTITQPIVELFVEGGDLEKKDNTFRLDADGKSTTMLIARIHKKTTTPVVTFATSLGAFKRDVNGDKMISVRAEKVDDPNDDRLAASVILVAPKTDSTFTQNKIAEVSVTISGFSDFEEIVFVKEQ